MTSFSILSHAWVKDQRRVKPVLKSFALGLALLFGLASQALAAIINVPADQPTIAAAIAAASAGDVIMLAPGTYVLAAPLALNKDVTIDGGNKTTTFIQGNISVGSQFILINGAGAGATLQNITFDKTDKNGTQAIIALQANNVTVQNCDFTGEYILGDADVSRGFVISPSITGFLIQNCSFTNLRQPGYLDNNTDGQILNNYVDQTRGWVLDGAGSDVIFNGNTWGTNAFDIALLNGTSIGPPYDPLLTLSANNDNAVFSDQRTAKAYNVTQEISYTTIQAANDAATNGDLIWVSDGPHNEDVTVTKAITIQGSGMDVCTVSGPIGGGSSTFQVSSPGVKLDGMTITRAGNNTTDWNGLLNNAGVAIQGQANDAEVKNCRITGTRTGIDINDSDGNNIHNNIITFNRTGMIFRNKTDNTLLLENTITDNWTIGILFLEASSGTNIPVQSALNSSFNENNISGNWYGQIQDRQSGGSLPAPGTTNLKNFECNWYGNTSPVTSTSNSAEPGYAAQIPVAYGGTAVPPGGQPDILGVASANLDYILYSIDGTDSAPSTVGFQPVPLSCAGGCPGGIVINTNTNKVFCTIQEAIDDANTLDGHIITVAAGTYAENVLVNKSLDIRGPNYNVSPNGGTRVAEAIVVPAVSAAGGEIFMVKKSNVSIRGFTIDGDNTLLNSTWIGTNGADINAAEGVTIYDAVPVVNNLLVSNNIIQNLGYFGVTLFGDSNFGDGNTSKTGHVISNNLIRNLGYYGTGNGFDKYGGGVLLYNSHYARVEDNVITNVRIGIQTGNYQAAHVGDPQFQVINNNQIETRYSGMFFNLHNYSPWTVSGNTITGKDNATEAAGAARPWRGMLLASLGNNMGSSTFSNNTIDGSAITLFTTGKEGINVWNVQNTSAVNITGGSISGVVDGIFLNNFEGYASDATLGAHANITGVNITPSGKGIRLLDSPSSTTHANVQATVTNCFITGGTDGAVLAETVASKVTGTLNNNSITGQSGSAINATGLANTVDASCNWYGTTDAAVVATKIQGNVNYLLFLTNGTDNAPGTAGFQPVPLSCTGGCVGGGAVINENTSAIFCSIQAAIDAAASGNRLKVKTGTYAENVNAVTGGKNIKFAPGNSPGCVTINGNFTLNTGDVLEMEIQGTTACTEYDQLIINGVVTLGGATLTLPSSMFLAEDGDQIRIIDNDGTDAIVGMFAEGNFATDGQNTYYINYAGGTGNDVVLTKCCGPMLDLGIFAATGAAPVGNKLTVKVRPNLSAINAAYSQGTFTIRTLASNAVANFSLANTNSPKFGYAQIGTKQTSGGYDYFVFNFEQVYGFPPDLEQWSANTEYDLVTLTYSCAVGNAIFELTNDAFAQSIGGKFYQELNGETNPGAQGTFYTATATGAGVLAISATSNSPICQTMNIDLNSTTTGGSSVFAYAWTGPDTYTNAAADPAPFAALLTSAGIYTVSVTDGNGCTATGSTTVVVPASGACVQNETNMPNQYYPTIKQAIDAALTVNGDVLNIPAGTWPENVIVTKALTLNGANEGVSCDGTRVAESIITGGAGTAVTISSNGVTIDGLQIEGGTGISSTGFNKATIKNNKVNALEIGIASTLLVASATDPYSINDNCVDFPVQAYDQQVFAANPTLSATQAPGVWYSDRYAPAGFTSAVFGGGTRLKHSINAADCQTCRPAAFQTTFYNTQGRKYDVAGTTAASIQLYVPSAWATTNKRMAGFWGTAIDITNAVSYYAILEFTSDGSNPRFRAWDSVNGVYIDLGLPAGFAYDQWYTLNLTIDGANIRYNIRDLSLTLPGDGSLTFDNVILQGHNTATPGVTYDIYWDNLNTHGSNDSQTASTVGIALAAASGTDDVTLQENNVSDAFYGYILSGVTAASADRTTVKGGTYTNLLQGVAVVNTLDGVTFAPSTIGVENANFESFGGSYPNIPNGNFHAGIYAFTGGSNAAHKVDILVNNVAIKNTGKTVQNSAGLYLADFSTGAGNRLNATVTLSTIENNKNRGIQVRGANATATISTSQILGNGGDPFGAGGNHGYGVYSGVGAQVTLLNNYITNPAIQVSDNVTALYEGVAPAATIIAHDNKISRNGNGELTGTTTGSINGTCNWWGSSFIDVIDADIDGNVTFIPYLNAGDDVDAATNGFQPVAPCVNPKRWYVNDNALAADIYTSAVGNDLNQGTKRRPFLTIGKAITTVVSTDTIFVDAGSYNEQSVVDKTKDNLLFKGAGLPTIVDFTGTVTNKPTLFDIAGDNTTIDGFKFKVDLAKLSSAIIATDIDPNPALAGTLDAITIKNNTIEPYRSTGTYFGSYGNRNAISINYGGPINYRNAVGGVGSIIVDNNIVSATAVGPFLGDADDVAFRSAVSVDEGAGTYTRNTFQTINHDVLVRFNSNGPIVVGGSVANKNYFNGGGVTIAEHNAGGGTVTISDNAFDGSLTASVLRLVTNKEHKVTTVSNNTFSNLRWGISLENYPDVTVSGNTFSPLAGYTTFRHITVNTKELSTSGATQTQVPVNGTFTGNTFNSLTPTVAGTAIAFYNHDSDNATLGTFTMGGAGVLANVFKKDFTYAAYMGDQTGSTLAAPALAAFPEYALGAGSNTTMACWTKDVDLTNNTFDVGSGQQLPLAMNNANRTLLEAKLYHKPDNSCLGKFFQTVEVMAKVFLQGPYDGPSNRMGDALRVLSDFPLSQPHAAINTAYPGSFVEVSNAGTEMTTAGVRDLLHPDNSIVDWVWLELRDKNNSSTVLFTRSALVQRDGDIVDVDGTSEVAFPNAYQDNYYLVVRHRNHLACMSAAPVDLTNPATMVDFTTAAQATFGATPTSARRLIKTGTYGLWAGNTFPKDMPGNGGAFRLLYNGSNNDRTPILNRVGVTTPLNVVTGYYLEDVNMNGEVKYSGSGNDRVIILNNVGASTPLNFITQEPNN